MQRFPPTATPTILTLASQIAADDSSLKAPSWAVSIHTVSLCLPVEFGTTYDFRITV